MQHFFFVRLHRYRLFFSPLPRWRAALRAAARHRGLAAPLLLRCSAPRGRRYRTGGRRQTGAGLLRNGRGIVEEWARGCRQLPRRRPERRRSRARRHAGGGHGVSRGQPTRAAGDRTQAPSVVRGCCLLWSAVVFPGYYLVIVCSGPKSLIFCPKSLI